MCDICRSLMYWRYREVENYLNYSKKIVDRDFPKDDKSIELRNKIKEAIDILKSIDRPKR